MQEQNSPIIFSEWLKRRRKALDMTQDELAKRAGCSVGALRKIESGYRRPSKQLAGLLAKALEIPPEEQQTFIRIARGESTLKRLGQPSREPSPQFLGVSSYHPVQTSESPEKKTKALLSQNRIPLQTGPLIGRENEIAALERLFNDPQCRLLTLTGIGGIGKTRLALEFAIRKQAEFPGGVFYLPLTSVSSPDKIVPAFADVLDYVFSGPAEPKEQLLIYLSNNIRQKALFIFDNLEHLLVRTSAQHDQLGLIELVSEILQRLPDVKILGTSRERLNLYGEWTYEIHGLSVPPVEYAGQLQDYNAIELFMKSAQRIRADYKITAEEQLPLIRICQLVEGVPLAIELAAAWVDMLSCHEIAQEIQANMDFLATSMRDIPERHRSIRATFDHSWKLLSDEERKALCQLAVFHGGFDRHAADEIAGASLPLLASLCAKSLVRRSENGRYDLHEVIRQYALSHLKDDPCSPGTHERYSEHYLTFLHIREKSLKNASQQEAIRQLTDEVDNILAAWAWAVNHKKYAWLELAGRAFGWYFEIAGLYREGIEQLELLKQALKSEPQVDQWNRLLGLVLNHQALLYLRKGEFEPAQSCYEESIAILRSIGSLTLLADALVYLGIILHSNGSYERATECLKEGLTYSRDRNEPWLEAMAIFNLGHIDSLLGCDKEGYEKMMTGLAIWRTLGDPHAVALGLNFLVPAVNRLGRYEEAKAFMQESIALSEQAKNRWGLGTAYRFLGLANIAAGQFEDAKNHLRKSLDVFSEAFVGWDIARSLAYLGDAMRMSGDLTEAGRTYTDALRLAIDVKAFPIVLDALSGLAFLQAQAGKTGRALLLCHYIAHHSSCEVGTKSRTEQLQATLEQQLDSRQIKAVYTETEGKTLEWIVKEALESATI